MVVRLPRWAPGQKIGLLGGSFNPAHEGHLLISALALRRLRLDRLWWLATPGNPLKENTGLPDLAMRVAAARALVRDPRIAVTGFEAQIGARFTYDTIAWLTRRAPGAHFVWIMGADNLAQFHRWRHWRDIAALAPIAVIDRPGSTLRATTSHAGATLSRYRVPESEAGRFALMHPPAFLFLHGPRSTLSSTALREAGEAGEG
jgi:nicotinate-nucleotide adenylyltransferase